jgi:hypothetical protein
LSKATEQLLTQVDPPLNSSLITVSVLSSGIIVCHLFFFLQIKLLNQPQGEVELRESKSGEGFHTFSPPIPNRQFFVGW